MTESQEQYELFEWASYRRDLRLMYHIPNGGYRDAREAAWMRKQGVKAGVPDICLPIPKKGYGALYIELKRADGGRLSEKQKEWIEALRAAGNRVEVCRGWIEAKKVIEEYMDES